MTHTVESLLKLADAQATERQHAHYHPELEARASLSTALTEVLAERDTLAKDAARFRWSMEHDDRHGYNFRKAYSAWDGNDSFVDFIDQLMKGTPT